MFLELLKTLGTALSIWEHKEKGKYAEKLMELERAYWEEQNKDAASRSDARLDNLEFELRLLARGYRASVGEQNAQNKP